MLPEAQKSAYEAFFDATSKNGILDEKVTIMIQLAASFAIGCYPWMEHFFGVAKESGLTDEEVGAVQAIVMGVSVGRIRAQFREARKNIGYEWEDSAWPHLPAPTRCLPYPDIELSNITTVEANGQRFDEIHVDGGAASQVFLYPVTLYLAWMEKQIGLEGEDHIYVIRNSNLEPEDGYPWAKSPPGFEPPSQRKWWSIIVFKCPTLMIVTALAFGIAIFVKRQYCLQGRTCPPFKRNQLFLHIKTAAETG